MWILCIWASVYSSFVLGGQLWFINMLASYSKQKLSEALWAQMAFWCVAMSSLLLSLPLFFLWNSETMAESRKVMIMQSDIVCVKLSDPNQFLRYQLELFFSEVRHTFICRRIAICSFEYLVPWRVCPQQRWNIHPVSFSLNLLFSNFLSKFFLGKQNSKRVRETDMLKSSLAVY